MSHPERTMETGVSNTTQITVETTPDGETLRRASWRRRRLCCLWEVTLVTTRVRKGISGQEDGVRVLNNRKKERTKEERMLSGT